MAQHVTVVTSVKRRPALSEEVIATFAKPPTKWHKLAIASNEQVFKIRRTTGNIFFLVAAVSATGLIISLTYRKTNFLLFSGLLTVGSTVAGLVFKHFGNTAPILKLRDDVKNNIEKDALANIRLTYPDENVISNQELNEWARYFLHTQPFENFLSRHWSSIFDFQLEDETKGLIKQKYFYRIYHPDNPKNLTLSSEVLNSSLFTREERNAIKEFQTSVKAQLQVSSSSDACQKYIAKSFSEIAPSQYAIYAWLFTIYIWNEKIGIEELRKKNVEPLKKFTPHFIDYSPERYIADRDAAALNYDRFVEKNGESAVHLISNFPHFLKLILQLNLGLIKTREIFKDDIARFGAAAQVEQAVLKQEWSQLAHLTYAQIRERNGQNVILEVSDPEVRKQLKEKFLGLSPAELANKDKYKEEIRILEIKDREIEVRLSQSWGEMSFKAILLLTPQIRQLIVEFSKKNGKSKAIEEIKILPVAEVLEFYQLLFQEGILDFIDYDFSNRLQALTTEQFKPLLQSHGQFILEKELLKKTDFKVTQFVSSFVYDHRQDFLIKEDLSKDAVWKMLLDFKLIKENCLGLRGRTLGQLSHESEQHVTKIKALETKHQANLRGIPMRVQERQKKSEGISQECRRHLLLAEETLKNKQKEKADFLQSCQQWELDATEKVRLHELDKASLGDLKIKKAQLESIPTMLSNLTDEHRKKQESLRNLEERLRERNKTSVAREILAIEKEIVVLNTLKFRFGDEQEKVLKKLQTLESPPLTGVDVQLRPIDRTAAVSAPTSETGAEVSSSTNSIEIEEAKSCLKAIETKIDEILPQVTVYRRQIQEKKKGIVITLEDFSHYAEHRSLAEKIDKTAEIYKAKLAEQTALQEGCRGLESLQRKVDLTEREIEQFPATRRNHSARTSELEREISGLQSQREAAETASKRADVELNSVKTTLSETLVAEENKSYKTKDEEENRGFAASIEAIKKEAEKQLLSMLG